MVHTAPSEHLPRLTSREDFETFRAQARKRWTDLWEGNTTVVSVGVGSSSVAKGSLDVLAACRTHESSSTVVREVSGNGAFWMEPWIEVKRPGKEPTELQARELEDIARKGGVTFVIDGGEGVGRLNDWLEQMRLDNEHGEERAISERRGVA